MSTQEWTGVWPVAPTPFNPDGTVDYDGMKRVLDCMIDQGVAGICILANFSEQFVITDEERERLTRLSLEHVAGRAPMIVTVSHFATRIAVDRTRLARDLGAAAVMMMPPYHGAALRAAPELMFEHFAAVGEVGLPIMVQDAPLSGVALSPEFLARMAREIEMLQLFKIECAGAADKLRALIDLGGAAIAGPFDGEEGITLMSDLEAGATGTMTSALIPDLIAPIVAAHLNGDRDEAWRLHAAVLPIINHENRQCGFRATKAAMVEGGVIASDACRHPIAPLPVASRETLLRLLRPADPVVLRWGR